MAADGLVFENAIAPGGATSVSASSFFTGTYPVGPSTEHDRKALIRRHLNTTETLPEIFKKMGYRTGAVTANPWTSRHFGYDQGFDYFEDFMDRNVTTGTDDGDRSRILSGVGSQLLDWWRGQDMYMSWGAYHDTVQSWLADAQDGDDPFFFWVFLVDVHMPYLPVKEFRSRSLPSTYAASSSAGSRKTNCCSGPTQIRASAWLLPPWFTCAGARI
jgi:arylsulfatase A-like enzyme